jgi:hypothetical protein
MTPSMDQSNLTSQISLQHDDHIWLTVGGKAWAIHGVDGDLIHLWRGFYPYIQYAMLDISNVNWESYHQKAIDLLYPPLEALKHPSPQDTQRKHND